MKWRTFLLGLLSGLAAAPTISATTSSVKAAPVPEAAAPLPLSEADLEAAQEDWAQAVVDVPHAGPGAGSGVGETDREKRAAWCEESTKNRPEDAACDAPP